MDLCLETDMRLFKKSNFFKNITYKWLEDQYMVLLLWSNTGYGMYSFVLLLHTIIIIIFCDTA